MLEMFSLKAGKCSRMQGLSACDEDGQPMRKCLLARVFDRIASKIVQQITFSVLGLPFLVGTCKTSRAQVVEMRFLPKLQFASPIYDTSDLREVPCP